MIPQDEYEICYWLRNLANHKHSDVRVALEAADEIERLRAELAEARRDVARYQWLRSRVPGGAYRIMGVIYSEGGAGVDEAIDAAMAGGGR